MARLKCHGERLSLKFHLEIKLTPNHHEFLIFVLFLSVTYSISYGNITFDTPRIRDLTAIFATLPHVQETSEYCLKRSILPLPHILGLCLNPLRPINIVPAIVSQASRVRGPKQLVTVQNNWLKSKSENLTLTKAGQYFACVSVKRCT